MSNTATQGPDERVELILRGGDPEVLETVRDLLVELFDAVKAEIGGISYAGNGPVTALEGDQRFELPGVVVLEDVTVAPEPKGPPVRKQRRSARA